MNILHICVTSKWFNIDNKIVDHRPCSHHQSQTD
ncbi:TPA: tryptophanase leader peptide [Escherichia coli]|nr:tryptophanase leader peptide [Escherichia coli]